MSALPLIERAREDGVRFVLTPKKPVEAEARLAPGVLPKPLMPGGAPEPGEQYRFHFDMTKCVGCKCCVVACNEQNGNEAAINWRRVGEIEGGWYPETRRFHLSMGCNHCLEPSCLLGCPVEAYTKDPLTGIVDHDANACIGCQYCTWNCSYGVPQYNPERGVVGKCDLCHGRLNQGSAPACASACPTGAITVEIVDIAAWRRDYAAEANAPGLPSADDSISTTRITLPDKLPPGTGRVDLHRVKPEHPHWPLVFLLVLTQLSVGALAAIWALELAGKTAALGLAALVSLAVGQVSLGAATLHLGRPAHAWRALRMWRRSWLSREVLLFGVFSTVAAAYAGLLWQGLPGSTLAGAVTALAGIAGITASARIYLVKARPAWDSPHTLAEFYLTAALLGPLFIHAAGVAEGPWLAMAGALAATGQLLNQALKLFGLVRSEQFELLVSGRLLAGPLSRLLLLRFALLIAGGIAIPFAWPGLAGGWAAAALALAGELLGRYLFFVSVVPKNMAASYLGPQREAA